MKSLSDNFVVVSCDDADEPIYSENYISQSTDPLQELGSETIGPRYNRIDSVVFAEPLENVVSDRNSIKESDKTEKQDDEENLIFIENVTVQESTGKKYKKYHIHIEDISKPSCPQPNCTRTFSTIKLLKAHIRKVHCADRNKYICEVCGMGFCAQYLLVRHASVHRGDRVPCGVCNKMLSQRTSLSAHLRTHSNARPYSCVACSKSFSRPSTLSTHVKFVHRDGQLECERCDARFSSRKQWSQHMASHRKKCHTELDIS